MNKKEFYNRLTQGLKITAKTQGIDGLNIYKNIYNDLHIYLPFEKLSTYGNYVNVKINKNVITLQFKKAVDKKYYTNNSYEIENKTIDYRNGYQNNMVILTEKEIFKFLTYDFVTEKK